MNVGAVEPKVVERTLRCRETGLSPKADALEAKRSNFNEEGKWDIHS